jgi:2,3-bisphosphoglycerate-independent phosphoglycerate mutase
MDREVHLERTARAFTMLVHAEGDRVFDAVSAIRGAYLRGLTDDAIPPIVLESKPGVPVATVKDNDVIVFFNYRGDRMRQLARALIWDKHGTGDAAKPQIDAYSLTDYGLEIAAAFPNEPERNTLSDILRQHGRRDCRITETEKHAHLTYFFDGCKEVSDGVGAASRRVLVPSREFKRPGEAVFEVTRSFTRELRRTRADLFVINLAAADLAAHSGDLEITKQAVSFTDEALGEIVRKMQDASGITLITADHGYCEQMIDPKTGETSFSHSTNPVPFCVVGGDLGSLRLRGGGALEDIAPTILAMLDLPKPPEMTGRDLRAGAANSAQPPRVIPETEKSLAIRELEIA